MKITAISKERSIASNYALKVDETPGHEIWQRALSLLEEEEFPWTIQPVDGFLYLYPSHQAQHGKAEFAEQTIRQLQTAFDRAENEILTAQHKAATELNARLQSISESTGIPLE